MRENGIRQMIFEKAVAKNRFYLTVIDSQVQFNLDKVNKVIRVMLLENRESTFDKVEKAANELHLPQTESLFETAG